MVPDFEVRGSAARSLVCRVWRHQGLTQSVLHLVAPDANGVADLPGRGFGAPLRRSGVYHCILCGDGAPPMRRPDARGAGAQRWRDPKNEGLPPIDAETLP